eukprot:1518586-Heterocapsa_arctica.AAC.1
MASARGDLMPPFRTSVGVSPGCGQSYSPVGPLASRDDLIPLGILKDPCGASASAGAGDSSWGA